MTAPDGREGGRDDEPLVPFGTSAFATAPTAAAEEGTAPANLGANSVPEKAALWCFLLPFPSTTCIQRKSPQTLYSWGFADF
jgi:hypothetical protein